MAEDLLQEARKAVGSGTFYGKPLILKSFLIIIVQFAECQNGHPYFVGEVSCV